jgi:hypothetical protein
MTDCKRDPSSSSSSSVNSSLPEQAETERNMLREALVGLVGVDTRDELEQLEAVMRLLPAPTADKVATINAIHSLLATLPAAADQPVSDLRVDRTSDSPIGPTRDTASSCSDPNRPPSLSPNEPKRG